MNVILVLCVLLSVAFSSEAASLQQGRIIGGAPAAPHQFPHTASIRNTLDVHLCSGFIRSSRWIVTVAASVVDRTISNTHVVVGTNTLSQGGFDYALSRIIPHPNFNANLRDNDIALLETVHEIDWYVNVQPIGLATTVTGGGVTGTVAGWGHLEVIMVNYDEGKLLIFSYPLQNEGTLSEHLQWRTLRTLTNAECHSRHTEYNAEHINDRMICTDNGEGVGMCEGDGGNALVSGTQVIAIASWGIGCASGAPDVYTRIAYHVPWINGIILS